MIGTNKKDATETVAAAARGRARREAAPRGRKRRGIVELLAERDAEAVLYAGWEAIDAVERARGGRARAAARQALQLGRAARRRARVRRT